MSKDLEMLEREKKNAAYRAIEDIDENMVLGLGSGSTIRYLINHIANKKISCSVVPTSYDSEFMARRVGIPVIDLPEKGVDLAIDGADEVAADTLALVKGGGGALTREKIVRTSAKKFVVIADSRKYVEKLGQFPVAIEILSFGWRYTCKKVEEFKGKATLRMAKSKLGPVISDNGNLILDLKMNELIEDPQELELALNSIPGVIENGVFSDPPDIVYIGVEEGVRIFKK